MKTECSIVRDLLPLYVESMVSEETARFVGEHLQSCPECQAELKRLKDGVPLTAVEQIVTDRADSVKPFQKTMKRMNRRFTVLAYSLIIFFIFLGFSLTGGEHLMYNSLIMPIVGVFGYCVFRWRAIYKVPLLLLLIDLAVFAFQLVDLRLYDTIAWTFIYSIFVVIGIAIAFLFAKDGVKIKNRLLKIVSFVVAILLIIGVTLFANGLVGNPISYLLAKNTAEKHLENTYGDTDFVLERVSFSFKDGQYHAYISSPSSIDSDFTLLINLWGKLRIDFYEDRVLNGGNTADRLGMDYRSKVDAVLDSPSFPYAVDIGYGDLEFISRKYADDPEIPDYAIVKEDLTLDGFYDVNALGAKAGKLTIYLDDHTVSYERLAEILLDFKRIFDDAGVKFYVVDFVLEYPKSEDGAKKEGRVEVRNLLYSDIYEDGMVERIKARAIIS